MHLFSGISGRKSREICGFCVTIPRYCLRVPTPPWLQPQPKPWANVGQTGAKPANVQPRCAGLSRGVGRQVMGMGPPFFVLKA